MSGVILTTTAKLVLAAVVLAVGVAVGALLAGRGPDRMAGPATPPATVTPSPAVPITPPPRPTADPAGAGGGT